MISNDLYVAKGKTIMHKGKTYGEGTRFPAATLGIDGKSFGSLVKDRTLISGKERNKFVHPGSKPEKPEKPKDEKPEEDEDESESESGDGGEE